MSQPDSNIFMTSPSAPPVPRLPSMYIDLDSEKQLKRTDSKLVKAD
jgi:hypothetical protein